MNANQKGSALVDGALTDEVLASSHSVLTPSMYGAGQKGLQQFYTPEIAATMIASVIGHNIPVLDPTAGDGSLLAGFRETTKRFGVEIDADQIQNSKEAGRGYHAIKGDIQHVYPLLRTTMHSWPGIVANPPFGLQWSDPSYRDGKSVNSTVLTLVYVNRLLAEDGQFAFICGRDRFHRQVAALPEASGIYAVIECDDLFEGTTLPCVIAFGIHDQLRSAASIGFVTKKVTRDMLDIMGQWVLDQREKALQTYCEPRTYGSTYGWDESFKTIQNEYQRRLEGRTKANREYDALLIGGTNIQWLPSAYANLALNSVSDNYAFHGLNGQPIAYFGSNESLWNKMLSYRDQGLITIEPKLVDAVENQIGVLRKERIPLYKVKPTQRLGFLTDIEFLRCKKDDPERQFSKGDHYRLSTQSKTLVERETRVVESKKKPGEYVEQEFEKQKKVLSIRVGHHTIIDGGERASEDIAWLLDHFDLPDPGEVATKHPTEIARLEALVREVMEEFLVNSRKWEEKNPTAKPFTIREFQVKDIARMVFKKGGLLSWEQGLGKTVGSLAFYKAAIKSGAQQALLVVTANDLIDQWNREAERFLGQQFTQIKTHGQAKKIAKQLRMGESGLYIAHYSTLSIAGTRGKNKLLPPVVVKEWQEQRKVKKTGRYGYYYWADREAPEVPVTIDVVKAYGENLIREREEQAGRAVEDYQLRYWNRELGYAAKAKYIQIPCEWDQFDDRSLITNNYIYERYESVTKQLTSRDLCPACEADIKNGWNGAFCEREKPDGSTCGYSHYAVKVKPIASLLSTAFRRGVQVYDEIQMMQARASGTDSKRSKAMRGPKSEWFLGMTGTPIKNYIDQAFWPLWKCGGNASPRFPFDYSSGPLKWESDFAVIEYKRNGGRRENRKALPEVTNLSLLWRILASSIIRRRKEETGEPLVPKFYHEIKVPLGIAQAEQIHSWLKNFPKLFKEKYPDHPVVGAGMHEILAPTLGLNWKLDYACTLPCGDPDYEWTGVEGVSNFTPANFRTLELAMALVKDGRKVLIGSNLKATSGWIAERLQEKGVNAVHILDENGDTEDAETRADRVYAFQTDDNVQVFCAGTKAIRLGHNLDAADAVILHGLDFDYETLEQFIARIHRLTSQNPVDVFVILPTLANQETITTRKWALLDMKGGSAELALDGRLILKAEQQISESELIRELMERGLTITNECVDEVTVQEEWDKVATLDEYVKGETTIPARPDNEDMVTEAERMAVEVVQEFLWRFGAGFNQPEQLDMFSAPDVVPDEMVLAQNADEMDEAEAELARIEAEALAENVADVTNSGDLVPVEDDESDEPIHSPGASIDFEGEDDEDTEEWGHTCANCDSDIDQEEYDRTGTDDFCESCPELDTDPRSAAMRGYGNVFELDEDRLLAEWKAGHITDAEYESASAALRATDAPPPEPPPDVAEVAPSADVTTTEEAPSQTAPALDPIATIKGAKELLDLGIIGEGEFEIVKQAQLRIMAGVRA